MSDITANVVVSMPSQLFTMARSFKAVANGKIYIGKIDTYPVNPENQIQVYVENEDGSHVPVSQPIIINAAGYPVYNGQIAKFVTVQGHSMAVYNAYGARQFYFPNVLKYDPDQFKQQLESDADGMGDALVAVKQPYIGSIALTQHDKNTNFISAKDFGATADGTLHPLSEKFSTLSAAQAVYPFVTSLTQSLDYAGIQAAINTGRNVLLTSGTYFVNATIEMNSNCTINGETNSNINRPETFIAVIGNIACFHYHAAFNTINIENVYIFYDGGRPTSPTGNDGKIGILIDGGTTSPGVMHIKNVEVDGAWWAIYDDSGNYLTKYTQVWARRVAHGFYKANGTTIQWDTCYVLDAAQAWYVVNCLSPQLINCAGDQITVDGSQYTFDSSGLYFSGCKCLTITGYDGESNIIKNTNGITASYIKLNDTIAHISGLAGHGNSMQTTGSGTAAFIFATGTSIVNIKSSTDSFLDSESITYTGSGYPNTLLTDSTAKIIAEGCRFKAPTGGTPVISTYSTGNGVFTDCSLTGTQTSGSYVESRSSAGNQLPAVYTAKGTQAVAANVATTLFELPNSQGMYLISVWAESSGTNFSSLQLAMWDGTTLTLTPLKSGGLISFTVTGRIVTITSQGTTTFNWTYTKAG
ncbi:phage head-binding domain-containing protein [Escherichia coli]|uniref:phage head-binding domain-containing protein n=1 Tax=Escherichia coli TaxID=562 RepID=UPI0002074DF1|nr:phage head-binding domain-containing protein [Escherichia coli]EGE65182.1 bifunctional tail domain protein [Escherichia coli STEC_7v]EGO9732016.1 hypothetical protein [Escherichia coli]EGP6279619.1 hypothetical protein [Escherichia coli]EIN6789043.1 phage head-binding domain-containing protein [Escherichia coli]EIP6762331.1 phage head-binding domain-containing protein [Escherichia coli]